MQRMNAGWVVAALAILAMPARAQYPSGEGRKPGVEEMARLTALGREITDLTQEELGRLRQMPMPAPEELALVLNNGYGENDDYPKTVAGFERLLMDMTNGGYNTIYCPYKDWRVPLCRKHGVKMMIDILAWHDDAQCDVRDPRMWQRPRVKQVCERVRGDRVVWGYNMWNDPINHYFHAGGNLNDHVCYLKQWDGTHPVWVGTKFSQALGWLQGDPGTVAWYDFHWFRGFDLHYGHCRTFALVNEERQSYMGRWDYLSDYNRNMFTLNQSIAWGLKTMIWFIGGPWDHNRQRWNPNHYLCSVNRAMQPVCREIGLIGRPIAHKAKDGKIEHLEVFSTPEVVPGTNQPKRDANGHLAIIGGWWGFPSNHWCQVAQGSVVAGFFRYPDGMDAIYVASHQPLEPGPQTVVLDLGGRIKPGGEAPKVGRFDRPTGKWQELPLEEGRVSFALAPADGQLLTVGPALRRDRKTFEELGKEEKTPDRAADALQVAWDIEGPEPEKAISLYGTVANGFSGQAAGQAKARLAVLEPRLKAEREANEALAAIKAHAAALGEAGKVPKDEAGAAAWQAEHKADIEKVQHAVLALCDRLPTSMGACRARELMESYGIASMPWDAPAGERK